MVTKDEINTILKPWGNSVDNISIINQMNHRVTQNEKRMQIASVARQWHRDCCNAIVPIDMLLLLADFASYQSDIIEMLANVLGFANNRIKAMEERIANLTKTMPTEYRTHTDD